MTHGWVSHSRPFGTTSAGVHVTRYDLAAPDGSGVSLLDYGATVLEVHVPDREGRLVNVALGHRDLADYETNPEYLGVTVGRTAGRRSTESFGLDGRRVHLPANEGNDVHLHGGSVGFHRRRWVGESVGSPGRNGEVAVTFRRISDDGEDGYPGRVEVRLEVAWTEAHELRLRAEATTDADTLVALTHHGTWNLQGAASGDVRDHDLTLDADAYLALDDAGVVTGEVRSVSSTPLDLRGGASLATLVPGDGPAQGGRLDPDAAVGEAARAAAELLRRTRGLDAPFVLRPTATGVVRPAATLRAPRGGITMRVLTDEPALQAYAGSFLGRDVPGRHGAPHVPYGGVALEPQRLPGTAFLDHPDGARLARGETYRSTTVYAFDVT